MVCLGVNYLIFKHLENFPVIFLLLFSNWILLWLENQFLCYFSILKLIEICLAYSMTCLVECFVCTWKNVFTAVLSGVFYKCQLCQLAQILFLTTCSIRYCERSVGSAVVLWIYLLFFDSVSFCFMYLRFFNF